MSNTGTFNIDLITLDRIVITNAAINNDTQISTLEKGKHEFNLTYNFEIGLNTPDKKIRIIFSCGIKTFDENSTEISVSAKFDIAFLFTVENLEELVTHEEGGSGFSINDDLTTSLTNLAYSTSRGIIYTKCQGTIIKSLIIPILSTKKLLDILQTTEGKQ